MRYKFLRWLRKGVFKTPEGDRSNKLTMIIYYILFPLRALYEHQAQVHYDLWANSYTIDGIKYSRNIFEWFGEAAKEGDLFMFVKKKDGCVTIQKITESVKGAVKN